MVNHTQKQYKVEIESSGVGRGWHISYGTRQIVNDEIYFLGEKFVYFTYLEHYMKFTDLLEEAGYINSYTTDFCHLH
tara:strand:- start:226 stop:456 length:231 start_codon:yes stop_codon:yes gene_type:complete